MGRVGSNWELGFHPCRFHPPMQVLRVCAVCAFSAPPAFPPCACPFCLSAPVRRLTSRISSESSPDSSGIRCELLRRTTRQVGRIRARCLTARFPNPPVRTVHATFTAHGSRERGIYGDFHFARIPPSPWCTACAFPG